MILEVSLIWFIRTIIMYNSELKIGIKKPTRKVRNYGFYWLRNTMLQKFGHNKGVESETLLDLLVMWRKIFTNIRFWCDIWLLYHFGKGLFNRERLFLWAFAIALEPQQKPREKTPSIEKSLPYTVYIIFKQSHQSPKFSDAELCCNRLKHRLQMLGEEIAKSTPTPKFLYGRSIFCLPHWPKFLFMPSLGTIHILLT